MPQGTQQAWLGLCALRVARHTRASVDMGTRFPLVPGCRLPGACAPSQLCLGCGSCAGIRLHMTTDIYSSGSQMGTQRQGQDR